ncbi:21.7 kDa class vi heat shock protein [Phtheirospermum japonicum]|uniref:21.7 kDa class vi heat shock protein n=1 Tax=Phtheirospermum japonicum TaxID=374723 RepID=A0A830BW74_9LAMI|nr:21.7 kDa class vi heat shock protein [Phtheirospermum japonicum]
MGLQRSLAKTIQRCTRSSEQDRSSVLSCSGNSSILRMPFHFGSSSRTCCCQISIAQVSAASIGSKPIPTMF